MRLETPRNKTNKGKDLLKLGTHSLNGNHMWLIKAQEIVQGEHAKAE